MFNHLKSDELHLKVSSRSCRYSTQAWESWLGFLNTNGMVQLTRWGLQVSNNNPLMLGGNSKLVQDDGNYRHVYTIRWINHAPGLRWLDHGDDIHPREAMNKP